MELSILLLLSLFASYISCGIINCKHVKTSKGFIKKALSALPNKKTDMIYCVIMVAFLIVLSLLFSFLYKNPIFQSIKLLCLASLLFPMSYIDYKQYRIPNKLVLLGVAYRFIILIFEIIFVDHSVLRRTIISEGVALAVITLFVGICMLLFRGGIGMGDIKFLMMMSVLQGFNRAFISLMVIMIFAFFVALYLILVKKKSKKDSFCFGPVIGAGTLVSLIMIGV